MVMKKHADERGEDVRRCAQCCLSSGSVYGGFVMPYWCVWFRLLLGLCLLCVSYVDCLDCLYVIARIVRFIALRCVVMCVC